MYIYIYGLFFLTRQRNGPKGMVLTETIVFVTANEIDLSQIVINTASSKMAFLEIVIFVSANEIGFSQIVINATF